MSCMRINQRISSEQRPAVAAVGDALSDDDDSGDFLIGGGGDAPGGIYGDFSSDNESQMDEDGNDDCMLLPPTPAPSTRHGGFRAGAGRKAGSRTGCAIGKRPRSDEREKERRAATSDYPGELPGPNAMHMERESVSVTDEPTQPHVPTHSSCSCGDRLVGVLSSMIKDLELKYCSISESIDKKGAEIKGLEQKYTQISVLENPEAALMGNGKLCCLMCTGNMAALRDGRQLKSRFIAKNGGCSVDRDLTTNWRAHLDSEMHAACVAHAESLQRDSMTHQMKDARAHQNIILTRLLNTAAFVSEQKLSYRAYEHLIKLQKLNGLDMGNINHGRHACKEMLLSSWQHGLDEIMNYMKCINPCTGFLPHIGVSADKLTDLAHLQWLIVMIRINVKGRPATLFRSVEPVDDTYDAEHEANGFSCYNKLMESLSRIGIETHAVMSYSESGEVKVYGDALLIPPIPPGLSGDALVAFKAKQHQQQARSYCFDGEGCFNGKGETGLSVNERLKCKETGAGDKTIAVMHDVAHALDLLIGDAHAKHPYIVTKIHPVIRAVYTYYVSSPKRKRRLMRLVADMNKEDVFLELHHLFEVRFVSSEWTAIKKFLTNLPAIVKDLEDDLKNGTDMTSSKRAQLTTWLRQMKQFKFVAYCILLVDIHAINTRLSVLVQSDQLFVIDVPDMIETYKRDLELLASGALGPEATARMILLGKGEVEMVRCVAKARASPLETSVDATAEDDFEHEDDEDNEEREEEEEEEDVDNVIVTEDDEEASTINLAAVTGDVKQRFIEFQQDFVQHLLENMSRRLNIPPSAKKLQCLFDFRKMPMDTSNKQQTVDLLLPHGNEEADWVIENLFPELDSFAFKSEALAARMFVFEHQDEFRVLKDPKKPQNGRYMCLTTIFERLFSGDVCSKPIPLYLHVLDYVISFMWQSCNSERAGSHINQVKTLQRIRLLGDTFNSLVFGTFNNVPVQFIDTPRLLERWRSEGHMSGTTTSRLSTTELGESKVLKRLFEDKKGRFLLSKDGPLAAEN